MRDPPPVALGGGLLRFRRICYVGALTEDTGNFRVTSEPQAASNDTQIRFVRGRNQLLLDARCQTVTVRFPEKSLRSVHRVIGNRIVVNTNQHGSRTLSICKTNAIVQFHKMIVLKHHNGLQAGAAQLITNPLRRIERQVLLLKKDRSASPAAPAAIFAAVTGIDHYRRKMTRAGRQPRARRLSATAYEQDQRDRQ